MTATRGLRRVEFETPAVPASALGARGELKWIPLSQIIIDPAYQRDVGAAGKRNIKQIVENFRWSLFSPLIVAPRGDRLFAAIDGQHRAIGALTHGAIPEVPCWVIDVDAQEEARAFAVINGQVTALNPLHVFRAKVVAGDKAAKRVVDVASKAGVTIVRNPTAGAMLKHGETQAPIAIARALGRFGEEVTVRALECVTRTGDNPAMLKDVVISAFAEVMAMAPAWRKDKRLFAAVKGARVKALLSAALQRQAEDGGAVRTHLAEGLKAALTQRLGGVVLVDLPPSPAEIKRAADVAAGKTKAAAVRATNERERKRAVVKGVEKTNAARAERSAEASKIFAAAPKAASPKSKPVHDTRAMIDAHIAKHGVTKVREAATANPSVLVDYLRGRGYDCAFVLKTRQCRIGTKLYDLPGLVAFAERVRAKDAAGATGTRSGPGAIAKTAKAG